MVFTGTIVKGIGEGALFMSMEHYKGEIKKKLSFNAYQGTLNLKVKEKDVELLKDFTPIRIDGFKSGRKKYGGANCYRARIKNINGAVIIPDMNKLPKNIIEFIAPVHVKSKLKLKEGDKVKIKL